MNLLYKNKGSVIIWVLRNNLQDAFIVWMIAQQRDRYIHRKVGRSTGVVSSSFFVDWIATCMAVSQETAKKRLEKAISYGFLSQIKEKAYAITSHRSLVAISLNDQQRKYEDNKTYNPIRLLSADREYTMTFDNWVDPKSLYNTVVKLSAIEEIQSGILGRGRTTQGEMINKNRRTTIRRTSKTGNIIIKQYVIFDAIRMLEKPTCNRSEAIKAFVDAERLAQKLGYGIDGKSSLHKKYINTVHCDPFNIKQPNTSTQELHTGSFLALQIPNAFTNQNILKEVPANRERCTWLHKAGLADRCRDMAFSRKQDQYTVRLDDGFISSRQLGVTNHSPGDAIARAVNYVNQILEIGQCFDQILADTGASGIRNPNSAEPRVWKELFSNVSESDVTPFVDTQTKNTIYFSC